MIRSQRRAHFRIWVVLAIALPLAIASIMLLAGGPRDAGAPVLLEPATGTGG